jgi:hypothetical protein
MAPQFSLELRDTVALENEKVNYETGRCDPGNV